MWPGRSYGSVYRQQFITRTICILLIADLNRIFTLCFRDWLCNAFQFWFYVHQGHKTATYLFTCLWWTGWILPVQPLSDKNDKSDNVAVYRCSRYHELFCGFSHYMRQLLEAVSYCHSHAIIHRNIQPQFVVVATSGNSSPIKLTGFSVSLQLGLSDVVHKGCLHVTSHGMCVCVHMS